MNGREVFRHATSLLTKSTNNILKKHNISIDDIDLVIPHQANRRIIESVSEKTGIPIEKFLFNRLQFSYFVIENMKSSAIL